MTIILRRAEKDKSSCVGVAGLCTNEVVARRVDKITPRTFRNHQHLIRWGCTDDVPFTGMVINTPEAIRTVSDKAGFRRMCQENDETLVPKTWFNTVAPGRVFPCIVRPAHHARGENLFVCRSADEMVQACAGAGRGYYVSELINKAAEFRVFIVQGRVACVYNKIPDDPNQVAWNVSQGGRFEHVRWDDWHLQAIRKSVEAFNLSGLDFGGVDVMVDRDGTAYVIEINSAPSLKFNSDGTPSHRMICMAKCFDWIISNNSKENIPLVDRKGGYKKFIHPAICSEALV